MMDGNADVKCIYLCIQKYDDVAKWKGTILQKSHTEVRPLSSSFKALSFDRAFLFYYIVNMTKVVNLKKDAYDIYIGRPSKWGNPFSHKDDTLAEFKVNSREEAISEYSKWIQKQPELLNSLHELKDKTLGCFCKPSKCHGDVLVKLVNELYSEDLF